MICIVLKFQTEYFDQYFKLWALNRLFYVVYLKSLNIHLMVEFLSFLKSPGYIFISRLLFLPTATPATNLRHELIISFDITPLLLVHTKALNSVVAIATRKSFPVQYESSRVIPTASQGGFDPAQLRRYISSCAIISSPGRKTTEQQIFHRIQFA